MSGQTDVRIDLTSNAFDAFLELQDDVGNVIAQNDDAGGSLDSRIIQTLQTGSYTILARSLAPGQTGSYQLSVSEGPDCSPVGVLELGQTVTGDLAADDCLFEFGGNMDNWSLSLASTQRLRIDLKSGDFDEVVLVRDQGGNIINGADGGGPTAHARLEIELSALDLVPEGIRLVRLLRRARCGARKQHDCGERPREVSNPVPLTSIIPVPPVSDLW